MILELASMFNILQVGSSVVVVAEHNESRFCTTYKYIKKVQGIWSIANMK